MPAIDLTPFGFTPTESRAYNALLDLGPSSGYAVAKQIGVARANSYQALNGLVAKEAALLIDENPLRFRAIRPDALLARIAGLEAGKLADLELQVRDRERVGDDAIVLIGGERGLLEVLTRWAGRSENEVWCIAPQSTLDALQPVWRKRDADGTTTRLWASESVLGPEAALPQNAVLFWCGEAAVIALGGASGSGHWVSDPMITATVRAAIEHINQTVETVG